MTVDITSTILKEVRQIAARLDLIDYRLEVISNQEDINMALLDGLTAEVANQTTVYASVVTLVNGLAAQIAASAANPAALAALVTQMQTNDASIAAAVAANTPAPVVTPPAGT